MHRLVSVGTVVVMGVVVWRRVCTDVTEIQLGCWIRSICGGKAWGLHRYYPGDDSLVCILELIHLFMHMCFHACVCYAVYVHKVYISLYLYIYIYIYIYVYI